MAKKDIAWSELGFSYMKTNSFVRMNWKDGKWSEPQILTDDKITMNVAATALHYGQAAFEGLKVFTLKDGSTAAFRPDENAKRMIASAERLLMAEVSVADFLKSLDILVKENIDFVPPYGTGASAYVRPLLIGTGAKIGVNPADEYDFYMLLTPAGPYYKGGIKPIDALVNIEFDRAAPRGLGNVKSAGNYAAGLKNDKVGKEKGFPISLYLDSKEHKYIDEFGTSNFVAITKDKKFVTPESLSVLPSITNASLQQLAKDSGMIVEKRPISIDELPYFVEVGSVGTAAVVTPISSITYGEKVFTFSEPNVLLNLYRQLTGIQNGDWEDKHNWMHKIV
jgi:branched-chain amino acid aminotransferase